MDYNPATTKFTTIYPNPASEAATLDFYLDNTSAVTLQMFNTTGQLVYTVTVDNVKAGFNYTKLPLDDFSNGVYIIKLLQNEKVQDVRMLSVVK